MGRPKVWGKRSARERRGSLKTWSRIELEHFFFFSHRHKRKFPCVTSEQTSTRKVSRFALSKQIGRPSTLSNGRESCVAKSTELKNFSSRTHRVKSRLKPRLVTNGSQHSLLKLLRKSYWPTLASCESSRRALARQTRSMRMCWPNSSHAT